jgi:hypothetical protein
MPINGHGEFGHRPWRCRVEVVIPKLRNRDSNGLIEAFGLHVDAVHDAFRIRVGDPTSRGRHRQEYIAGSLFLRYCSGDSAFENGYKNGYSHKIKGRSGKAGRPLNRS